MVIISGKTFSSKEICDDDCGWRIFCCVLCLISCLFASHYTLGHVVDFLFFYLPNSGLALPLLIGLGASNWVIAAKCFIRARDKGSPAE